MEELNLTTPFLTRMNVEIVRTTASGLSPELRLILPCGLPLSAVERSITECVEASLKFQILREADRPEDSWTSLGKTCDSLRPFRFRFACHKEQADGNPNYPALIPPCIREELEHGILYRSNPEYRSAPYEVIFPVASKRPLLYRLVYPEDGRSLYRVFVPSVTERLPVLFVERDLTEATEPVPLAPSQS